HFPDSQSALSGIDSRILLRRTLGLIEALGYEIANVDATVIAQKPKLAPYFAAMCENLAADLRIDPGQVNIKGTTTEGMGFAGREEGIAAHAIALLYRSTNTE
ncbi:MAG: 2-C-methyl-D-erythritol 2,4-cyclodiphosphate synthase, partial [Beggiatoa sp.]|nr:2-C-methyl-D-erythritol 2,4-cyclodiphosphate synthase [Beggiatoa sp.]